MNFLDDFSRKGKDLRIQPKPATWRKLEQRLDSRRRYRQEGMVRRNWVMAAALGILIVTSLILVFRVQQTDKTMVADAGWEEIQTSEEAALPAPAAQPVKNIPEGQVFKQLVSKTYAAETTDLDWLEGEWQGIAGHAQVTEKWKREKSGNWSHQIWGKGVETDQDMYLQAGADGNWELLLKLEAEGVPVRFELEQQDASQLVFTNESLDFPQRVAFRRLGPDNLSIILYNPELMGLREAQVAYLQQHNSLQPQLVRRDLERLGLMY